MHFVVCPCAWATSVLKIFLVLLKMVYSDYIFQQSCSLVDFLFHCCYHICMNTLEVDYIWRYCSFILIPTSVSLDFLSGWAGHPPWRSHTLLPENVRLPTASKITRELILETLKDSGLNNLTITTCNILQPAISIPWIYLFYSWEFLFPGTRSSWFSYTVPGSQLDVTWWAHEGLSSPHRHPSLFREFWGMKSYKEM